MNAGQRSSAVTNRSVVMRTLLLCAGLIGGTPEAPAMTNLVSIASWTEPGGQRRIGEATFLRGTPALPGSVTNLFRALPSDAWTPGCIPVYGAEKDGYFELSRKPRGIEGGQSEPLFFALPPENEPATGRLAGQWQCSATRGTVSDAWFVWQLTLVDETIFGRFDPSTDYRVASLRGGTLRSNHFELVVDYINDAYRLKGEWHDGRLRGEWEKHDGEERGQWEASRDRADLPAAILKQALPLYEWRRHPHPGALYSISSNAPGREWTRIEKPLCRVWPLPPKPIPASIRSP